MPINQRRKGNPPDRTRPPDLAVRRLLVKHPRSPITHDYVKDPLLKARQVAIRRSGLGATKQIYAAQEGGSTEIRGDLN